MRNICLACGGRFSARRDAKTCSAKCRVTLHRHRRRHPGPVPSAKLRAVPITFAEACAFVAKHHRHHPPPIGHKFSIAAKRGAEIVGVAIVGRPVSRMRDDGHTLEVSRLCTDGTRNVASFLLGRACKVTFAFGYMRIGTYVLASETGVSLQAAGWRLIGEAGGGSWSVPSRPRADKHPLARKRLYENGN
jgi:hypothetical protein